MNIKRTVHGYARSGLACIMIEDQVGTGKGLGYYFVCNFNQSHKDILLRCYIELMCLNWVVFFLVEDSA